MALSRIAIVLGLLLATPSAFAKDTVVTIEFATPNRVDEAKAIGQHPQLVRREGNTLIIAGPGYTRELARFTDGQGECAAYWFRDAMSLVSPATYRKEDVAVLNCGNGDIAVRMLVKPDGSLLHVGPRAMASANGRYVFVNHVPGKDRSGIFNWLTGRYDAIFDLGCGNTQTEGAFAFKTSCYDPKTHTTFEAVTSPGATGVWSQSQTVRLDAATMKPLPATREGLKTFQARDDSMDKADVTHRIGCVTSNAVIEGVFAHLAAGAKYPLVLSDSASPWPTVYVAGDIRKPATPITENSEYWDHWTGERPNSEMIRSAVGQVVTSAAECWNLRTLETPVPVVPEREAPAVLGAMYGQNSTRLRIASPVYNQSRTEALVLFDFGGPGLFGGQDFLLLRKNDAGIWTVVGMREISIS